MRIFAVATAALAIAASPAFAQSSGMKGMEMQGDMKGMDKGSMKGDKSQMTHKGVGVVKKIDAKAGTVTIDHEPIKSMSWPKMTMSFQVKDKAMLEKVGEGRKVDFEFETRGKEHVITSLK
jgi:Cu(I)/Ag(I) efflux system protein CusF